LPNIMRLWISYSSLDNLNLDFILSLEESQKETISEWLTRLAQTKEFALNQVQLAKLACQMLSSFGSNQAFADYYFNQAEANNAACGDRAAMAFNELYTMWRILASESSAPFKDKLQLLVKFARTHTLRKTIASLIAAQERQQRQPERESVETFLHYEGELADELGLLTAIKSRKYNIGQRYWIQPNQLKTAVENNYLDELVKMDSLQSLIDQDEDFKNRLTSEDDARVAVLEEKENGNDAEYLAAIAEAKQQRNTSIKRWVLANLAGNYKKVTE
jgi:hypothetical protein